MLGRCMSHGPVVGAPCPSAEYGDPWVWMPRPCIALALGLGAKLAVRCPYKFTWRPEHCLYTYYFLGVPIKLPVLCN